MGCLTHLWTNAVPWQSAVELQGQLESVPARRRFVLPVAATLWLLLPRKVHVKKAEPGATVV